MLYICHSLWGIVSSERTIVLQLTGYSFEKLAFGHFRGTISWRIWKDIFLIVSYKSMWDTLMFATAGMAFNGLSNLLDHIGVEDSFQLLLSGTVSFADLTAPPLPRAKQMRHPAARILSGARRIQWRTIISIGSGLHWDHFADIVLAFSFYDFVLLYWCPSITAVSQPFMYHAVVDKLSSCTHMYAQFGLQ